jgi:hypothetical protein
MSMMDKSKSSKNLFNSKNSIQKDEDQHDNNDDTNEIIIIEDKLDEEREEVKTEEGTEDRFVQNMTRKNKIKQVMSIKINKSTFFNANSFVRGESKPNEMGGVTI